MRLFSVLYSIVRTLQGLEDVLWSAAKLFTVKWKEMSFLFLIQTYYNVIITIKNDDSGDLHADSHNILNTWKNCFSQLLNGHNVIHVRHIRVEVHTAEPLVPGPSRLEGEIAIAKLKKYKSPGSDEIPAELIQAGGEILLLYAIHKLINSVWNKAELADKCTSSQKG
jgi:hypothetical protein